MEWKKFIHEILSPILSLSLHSVSLKDDSQIHEAKSNKVRIRAMFDCELKFEEVVDELLKKLELNCGRKRGKLELKKELNDKDDSLSTERNGSDLMIEEMEISEKIQREQDKHRKRSPASSSLPPSLTLSLSLSRLYFWSTFVPFVPASNVHVIYGIS